MSTLLNLTTIHIALALFLLALPLQAKALCQTLNYTWADWKPYVFMESNELQGLDFKLVEKILDHAGCKISYNSLEVPWPRQLLWVEQGKADFVTGASKTPERELYAHFSLPYRQESVALFIRKSDIGKYKINTLADIVNSGIISFGVFRGSYNGEEFQRLKKTDRFRNMLNIGQDDKKNLLRLVGKRVDALLMDTVSGVGDIKKFGLENDIVRHPMPAIITGHVHIMFSKKTVPLSVVKDVNRSYTDLKKSGQLENLFDEYLH